MRTEQVAPESRNGKFAAVFNTYRGVPGEEYLVSTCTSAFLFDSEDAAIAAGTRALDVLEATGKYPNMCEEF